jgi:hypothetical protein
MMFARVLSVFLILLAGLSPLPATAREFIIVSGGPALRFNEEGKKTSHDKYWANFIDAASNRIKEIQPSLAPGDTLTWMIFRPSYVERGKEMNEDLLPTILDRAASLHVNALWFDRTPQFINYLNAGQNRKAEPIAHLEFFTHSNKACMLWDYSNQIDAMSISFFHVLDLKNIRKNDFTRDAYVKSWGCHSGELFTSEWKSHFGMPMEGAIGKTDYTYVTTGKPPVLSSKNGKWSQ